MANPEPVQGKCNARRSVANGGGFCGNKPFRKKDGTSNGRCKFHGGASVGAGKGNRNSVKNMLYTKSLRDTLSPEDRKVWDNLERSTSLENEILLARTRVLLYQRQLAAGEQFIEACGKSWSIDDLLDRALGQLRSLTTAQQHMHPGANVSGDMAITVTVDVAGSEVVDADVPNLDADGPQEQTPVPSTHDEQPADAPTRGDLIGGDDP